MKILKFKKTTKGTYKVFLDNNQTISLYEDVIINNKLLLTKEIKDDELDDLIKQNNDMHVYSIAINYISIRMRSIKELKEYLKRKQVSENVIEETVDKLVKNGYLNDFNFAKAYVNDQLLITNKGPLKIKQELVKFGVDNEIINEVIDDVDKELIKEKLSNLMDKQIKLKKGSTNVVKIKLLNYFHNIGYSKEDIINELSNHHFKLDVEHLKKEYNKLKLKYSKKYDESELEHIIKTKLYQKGYTADEINKIKTEE